MVERSKALRRSSALKRSKNSSKASDWSLFTSNFLKSFSVFLTSGLERSSFLCSVSRAAMRPSKVRAPLLSGPCFLKISCANFRISGSARSSSVRRLASPSADGALSLSFVRFWSSCLADSMVTSRTERRRSSRAGLRMSGASCALGGDESGFGSSGRASMDSERDLLTAGGAGAAAGMPRPPAELRELRPAFRSERLAAPPPFGVLAPPANEVV
mmetsp:Transcript_65946/g.204282  ORF Transcript_65946/g.204282 Transcript_65946/m.204282 type:complete len:215 (+) Transcript_65946:443-1087(+)